MNTNAGHALQFPHSSLTPPATWGAADTGWEHREPAPGADDWTGLERLEQVVARQRRYLVRDVVAAVAFAALSVAVVLALL